MRVPKRLAASRAGQFAGPVLLGSRQAMKAEAPNVHHGAPGGQKVSACMCLIFILNIEDRLRHALCEGLAGLFASTGVLHLELIPLG